MKSLHCKNYPQSIYMWLIQANIGVWYNKENLTEYKMFSYLIVSKNLLLPYNVYNWIMQFHAT